MNSESDTANGGARVRTMMRAMDVSGIRRITSEGRGFLQERIALFGRSLFLVLLIVPAAGITLVDVSSVPGFARRVPVLPYSLLAVVILGALWLFCRRGAHSLRMLAILDAASTIVAGSALATLVLQAPIEVPPGMPTTFFLTYLLVARAIVVPSEWLRTLWISSLAALPSVALILWYGASQPGRMPPTTIALPVWCVTAVALATWTSHVVYRLRRSLREAQQLGQYTLEDQIGEGGMGVVYRARHALLRRPTVVKLLPLSKAGQANLARFEREVQLTSQLASPNTVAVYDFGRTEDGIFYYAMEYLDGIDLERLVEQHGPQPAARVVRLLAQICTALAEAHEAGLIHRDVKPSNVMLCRHGGAVDVVKVLDFGLVKDLTASKDAGLTQTETVLGTPLYASPESINEPETLDERSDLYAVGALGYYLLTGAPVFEGRTVVEVYARHLYATPAPPSERVPGVPADLEALVLKCLDKQRDARPRNARALRSALLACEAADRWTDQDAQAFWSTRTRAVASPERSFSVLAETLPAEQDERTA